MTPTRNDVKFDNKFLSLKAEVLSKYGALISIYSRVSLEYDFILLKYNDIAVANDIKQWDKLRLASEKVNGWKLENTNIIDKLLALSNSLENIKTESEFLNILIQHMSFLKIWGRMSILLFHHMSWL